MSKQLLRFVALCSVVCASSLFAQQKQSAPQATGRIIGIVVADNGPLVAAQVMVRNVSDTTKIANAMTAADGRFLVDGLSMGTYRLRVVFLGFKVRDLPNVTLTPAAPVAELGVIKMERLLLAGDRRDK